MVMFASTNTSSDIIQLLSRNPDILKVLTTSLKQKPDSKNNPNWIDLTTILFLKYNKSEIKVLKNKTIYYCSYYKK